MFDTFPTNTFSCPAARIFYFSPFCFSPPSSQSLVLVDSLCSLRSPRFISLSFYFCLFSIFVSRETFCLNNLCLPNILAAQMTILVLSKMRNRTMHTAQWMLGECCRYARSYVSWRAPSSYQAGSQYSSLEIQPASTTRKESQPFWKGQLSLPYVRFHLWAGRKRNTSFTFFHIVSRETIFPKNAF